MWNLNFSSDLRKLVTVTSCSLFDQTFHFCSFLKLQPGAVPQRNFLARRAFEILSEDSDSTRDFALEKCQVGGGEVCSAV